MWNMMAKKMPIGMPKMGMPKMGVGGDLKGPMPGAVAASSMMQSELKGAMPGAVPASPMMQSELKGAMPGAMQAAPMMQSEFGAPRLPMSQGPLSEDMLASRYGSPMQSFSPWGGLLSKGIKK